MSALHDYAPLLSAPPHADHFASSFLQAYHHPPPPPLSSYEDRYLAAPFVRTPTYTPAAASFEYAPQTPSAPAFYPREHQHTHTNTNTHHTHPPPLRGFDPRPPHAGWTPKEEVDDDDHARQLLARPARPSPQLPSPIEPPETHSPTHSSPPTASKTYSFVSLPGNAIRKRPRRRYDEIERLYACAWPDCTKAYGTLNHLNAHVSMQRHGPKRSPAEFKELRKQWRQQKKQEPTGLGTSPMSTTSSTEVGSLPPVATLRRRRGTEPTLVPPQGANMHPRLSLGDLRFPAAHSDEGPSPTSSASDSANYWQDSPVSPPPLGRLPPDSTLLTPLPGYRPPTPPMLHQPQVPGHHHHHHEHAHHLASPHRGLPSRHSPRSCVLLPLAGLTTTPPLGRGPEGSYEEYDERRA